MEHSLNTVIKNRFNKNNLWVLSYELFDFFIINNTDTWYLNSYCDWKDHNNTN
jgi:hypothetical protein